MRRATTPYFEAVVNGYDLTGCTVVVTLRQAGYKTITLEGDRLNIQYVDGKSSIIFQLTQEETLSLKVGDASLQVRFVDDKGRAEATKIGIVSIKPVLYEEVI